MSVKKASIFSTLKVNDLLSANSKKIEPLGLLVVTNFIVSYTKISLLDPRSIPRNLIEST